MNKPTKRSPCGGLIDHIKREIQLNRSIRNFKKEVRSFQKAQRDKAKTLSSQDIIAALRNQPGASEGAEHG